MQTREPKFTQAMKDVGGLPPIGSWFIDTEYNTKNAVKSIAHHNGCVVYATSEDMSEVVYLYAEQRHCALIKKTITVNGFKVPEPERERLNDRDEYFLASPSRTEFFESYWWKSANSDSILRLSRGLIHLTKEAAIAHAKAMLGINPDE